MSWLSDRWRVVAGGFAVLAAALGVTSASAATAAPAAAERHAAAGPAFVEAWGRNDHGQLGNDSTVSSKLPVKVKLPPGVTITSVRAGCLQTVALTSTGQVLAWGDDQVSELGDNLVAQPSSPTPVTVKLPPGTKVTAIRAGCAFGLALTSTGGVLGWGFNTLGALGDGTDGDVGLTANPVKLPDGTKIKGISAGFAHSLAVTTTGQVLAWGDNLDGELGDGTTNPQEKPIPVSLPGSPTVTAVAAGNGFSLALTSQGQVWAWGKNVDGELGDGTTSSTDKGASTPVMVKLRPGTKVKSLFAGGSHSLALTSTGQVLAWGANSSGQLGDGTTAPSDVPLATALPSGTTVTAIAAGDSHSLALTSTGKVLAWGDGVWGPLGSGFTLDEYLPTPVQLPAGLVVTDIASGPTAWGSMALVHQATG
jgi:alpha-tubulin suppressor-like RCC1 family protein